MEEKMISYLQAELTNFKEEFAKYGREDRMVNKMFDTMIANKEMVETLIGKPVNLGKDGKVTIEL